MASQTLQTIRNGWAPEIKRLNDNLEKLEASLSYNSHPDCQRVKMQLVQALGIEDFELWTCPEQYRHLLHDERRQELNKTVKTIY